MDVFEFIDIRAVTRNDHACPQLPISYSEGTTSLYVTVYLSLTSMDNLTAKTDIANLMWSFENLDVKAEEYPTKVENILKSINDLRTAEVTTTMSPEKVDQ